MDEYSKCLHLSLCEGSMKPAKIGKQSYHTAKNTEASTIYLEYTHILNFLATRKHYNKRSSDLGKTKNFKCPTIQKLKTVLFWYKHDRLLIGFKILIFSPILKSNLHSDLCKTHIYLQNGHVVPKCFIKLDINVVIIEIVKICCNNVILLFIIKCRDF